MQRRRRSQTIHNELLKQLDPGRILLTRAVPSSLCCRQALAMRWGRGANRSETRSSRAAVWSLAHTGCLSRIE